MSNRRGCDATGATAAARHANSDKVACHGARALGHLLAVPDGAIAGGVAQPAAVQQPLQVLLPSMLRLPGRCRLWVGLRIMQCNCQCCRRLSLQASRTHPVPALVFDSPVPLCSVSGDEQAALCAHAESQVLLIRRC